MPPIHTCTQCTYTPYTHKCIHPYMNMHITHTHRCIHTHTHTPSHQVQSQGRDFHSLGLKLEGDVSNLKGFFISGPCMAGSVQAGWVGLRVKATKVRCPNRSVSCRPLPGPSPKSQGTVLFLRFIVKASLWFLLAGFWRDLAHHLNFRKPSFSQETKETGMCPTSDFQVSF